MLENLAENYTTPILKDDPQQIDAELTQAEEKRSKYLRYILVLKSSLHKINHISFCKPSGH